MPPQSGRPLARQLLLPVVGLLVAGVLANVAFAAWLAARRHSEEIAVRQQQVADTLASSRVALSPAVLTAMQSLTGNHFIIWNNRVVTATLPASETDTLNRSLADLLENRSHSDKPDGMIRVDGTSYSVTSIQSGGRPETVLVLTPTAGFSRALLDAIWPVLAVAAATLALLVPLGVHATDRLSRRIGRIERHVGRIAGGDFGRTIHEDISPAYQTDEISRLLMSVNAMSLALAELRSSLAAGERQRLLGQLAAGFAHEFRNGLTGARLAIDLHTARCQKGTDETGHDESLSVARQQLDIMEEEVHGLLALGRTNDSASGMIPLDILLDEVRELVDPRAAHAGVRLTVSSSGSGVVSGRRESLRAAVANLALNAIEAACENAAQQDATHPGSVHIWAEQVEQDDGTSMVSIIVEDSGNGPPTELSMSVFDPFVTGKPEGIGIGLALVKMVADEHGGSVVFERRQSRTRFILTLPEASISAVEESVS